VKFRRCDDFSKLFHIDWLDVDYVEALITDVEIPKINSKIVCADVCLSIGIDTDAVDMIGVCVCIDLSRYCSHNGIVMSQ
jgi:hypothetical protein